MTGPSLLAPAVLAAPLGLRDLAPVYFVPLLALLALLVEREIVRSAGGPRARMAVRILGLASLPLLIAFVVLVALRLDQIMSGF